MRQLMTERRGANLTRRTPPTVGDLMWVRETWALAKRDGDRLTPVLGSANHNKDATPLYKQNRDHARLWKAGWRRPPSMPRWASRITLEVVGVYTQWLQDITDAEALAEGVPEVDLLNLNPDERTPVARFAKMWRNRYGPLAWDNNPQVYVLELKTHTKNIDALLEGD